VLVGLELGACGLGLVAWHLEGERGVKANPWNEEVLGSIPVGGD
jgi:hypothetical protein